MYSNGCKADTAVNKSFNLFISASWQWIKRDCLVKKKHCIVNIVGTRVHSFNHTPTPTDPRILSKLEIVGVNRGWIGPRFPRTLNSTNSDYDHFETANNLKYGISITFFRVPNESEHIQMLQLRSAAERLDVGSWKTSDRYIWKVHSILQSKDSFCTEKKANEVYFR